MFLVVVPGEEVNFRKCGIGLQDDDKGGFETVVQHGSLLQWADDQHNKRILGMIGNPHDAETRPFKTDDFAQLR